MKVRRVRKMQVRYLTRYKHSVHVHCYHHWGQVFHGLVLPPPPSSCSDSPQQNVLCHLELPDSYVCLSWY